MKLRAYPKYKESGVEWLGEVPEEWVVKRLRFIAGLNPSKSECSGIEGDSQVSFLPMDAVGDDGSLNLEQVRPICEVNSGYTYFRDGDVTIAKITPCFENGKGAVMRGLQGGIGFGTTELIVIRPILQAAVGEYIHLLFVCAYFRKFGESWMYGAGGQKRVPDDFVRNFKVGIPPVAEQHAIAAFLDAEVSRMDALMAEYETLIDLLKEKRKALISQAVTKGLNPDAPMKDSGVAWLGVVPEEWVIKPVWTIFQIGRGRVISNEEILDNPGSFPVYSSQTENDGEFGRMSSYEFVGNYITWTTDGANAGTVFIRSGKFNCTNVCGTLKPIVDDSHIRYLKEAISICTSFYVRHDINPKLMNNVMAQIRVPYPPGEEQSAIAAFLDAETSRMDALVQEAENGISLLRERRTTLISDAVTGKVDVREFQL